jgi:hypothetical protein
LRNLKLGQPAMIAAKVNSLQNKEFGNQKKLAENVSIHRRHPLEGALGQRCGPNP